MSVQVREANIKLENQNKAPRETGGTLRVAESAVRFKKEQNKDSKSG